MKLEKAKAFFTGLIVILLQVAIFRHLTLFGLQSDLLLLFMIWLMTRQDRTTVILITAALSFLQDAFLDLWGMNLFAKTAIAFFAYRFVPKIHEHRLLVWQAFLLIFIIAFFHNIILISLSFFTEAYTAEYSFWVLTFGNTLYTSVIGMLVYLFRS